MKEVLLSVLRNKNTGTADFRRASDQLAHLVSAETLAKLKTSVYGIETPVGTANGASGPDDVMFVPIVRAALSILPAFLDMVPAAPVAFLGIERDETTALPNIYYRKFPPTLPNRAVIIDPMLATGGSAMMAVDILVGQGLKLENIYFTGVVAAQFGLAALSEKMPQSNITVAAIDPDLNEQKYIVPGLGDYGDRYYGT
ncbi:MAG: uracil phosphoribosyltransferase [Chloroflexi bacterium]|nr:uracil phosphoribosyltransferase [Chloroflexota bacterium]MDA1226656.1 uracil phosphoribosyltransferase [Chloroflexota bacterium]